MKLAIASSAIGEAYSRISAVSFPTIKAYAARIGADFLVLNDRTLPPGVNLQWEKLQLLNVLKDYDRVMWMDSDLIVHPDTPSLFDVVPPWEIGALNEAPFPFYDRHAELSRSRKVHGFEAHDWDGKEYFNIGVFVVSRCHSAIFVPPAQFHNEGCPDQAYFNVMRMHLGIHFKDITLQFNRIFAVEPVEDRFKAHIIHYAGWPGGYRTTDSVVARLVDQMKEDLASWQEKRSIV